MLFLLVWPVTWVVVSVLVLVSVVVIVVVAAVVVDVFWICVRVPLWFRPSFESLNEGCIDIKFSYFFTVLAACFCSLRSVWLLVLS